MTDILISIKQHFSDTLEEWKLLDDASTEIIKLRLLNEGLVSEVSRLEKITCG